MHAVGFIWLGRCVDRGYDGGDAESIRLCKEISQDQTQAIKHKPESHNSKSYWRHLDVKGSRHEKGASEL